MNSAMCGYTIIHKSVRGPMIEFWKLVMFVGNHGIGGRQMICMQRGLHCIMHLSIGGHNETRTHQPVQMIHVSSGFNRHVGSKESIQVTFEMHRIVRKLM